MKPRSLVCLLIPLGLAAVVPHAFATADDLSCADKSVAAGAVRTRDDIRAFVQCAYEYTLEVGTEAARRAFNEEERWKSGPIYVFVAVGTPGDERLVVFPPAPLREGLQLGPLVDVFGNEFFREGARIVGDFGEGWLYYSFSNPVTGRDEPKASYIKSIDWGGTAAAIGAGVYLSDIPVTCLRDEVNALRLAAEPSDERLQEFVRCAAMELETMGYFGSVGLSSDPRWRQDSIYLFGVDANGNTLFSGDPYRRGGWASGGADSELTSLGDRDDLSVAVAFGETFLYYRARNPATGLDQRKVVFVKRVVVYGLPILIGSGYFLEE